MTTLDRPLQPRRLVGPLLLIGLGMLFLLDRMGLSTWRVWQTLLYLWPVLLIAAGIELIVGRRRPWVGWLITLVVVGVVLGGMILLPGRVGAGTLTTEQWSAPLGTAQAARVELQLGAGSLKLAGVEERTNLVSASLQRRSNTSIAHTARLDGTTAVIGLREQSQVVWPLGGTTGQSPTWDVKLSTALPTALTISNGAGQTNLDLSAVQLTELQVSAGAGQTLLRLPRSGVFTARLSTGAGQTIVTLPRDLAARIRIAAGVADTSVTGDFVRDGDTYVSPGYDTAANRVDLEVSGGAGSIRVQQERAP